MKMHTHVYVHRQVEEIAQWIRSVMRCKTKKSKCVNFAESSVAPLWA